MRRAFAAEAVFDGHRMHRDAALVVEDGSVVGIEPAGGRDRLGGVIAPGFIDLQVNGGGGRMVDGNADAASLAAICDAHAKLGATGILPTLITDTPDATAAVIAAGIRAAELAVPGFLGLHLEGPHLDPRRKGAHDPALIRPMDANDLARLCEAAARLPALMLTVAPEAVTPEQIAQLARAGVIVSLGHSDCSYDTARATVSAGAVCATHLFNAMSQLGNREPGLVGAVLDGRIAAGLIADGIHVSPATLRIALAARPEGLFLVSDAMAVAGSGATEFELGGRRILRRDGRLTLEDGTLAGADLSLPQAVAVMVRDVGLAPEAALAMAGSRPAAVIGAAGRGVLSKGGRADFVHLAPDWALVQVWRAGEAILSSPL